MTTLDYWIVGSLMFGSIAQSIYIVWHARRFHAPSQSRIAFEDDGAREAWERVLRDDPTALESLERAWYEAAAGQTVPWSVVKERISHPVPPPSSTREETP